MDAQSRGDESTALQALATACIAQAALDYDAGLRPSRFPRGMIEENMWRAIRYGLDGRMIDLPRGERDLRPGRRSSGCWTGPLRRARSCGSTATSRRLERHARRRQRRPAPVARARGRRRCASVYAATVAETRDTYAPAAQPATR